MRDILASANQLTLRSTRLDIEKIKLVEYVLREFGEAYSLDNGHLLNLAALGVCRVAVTVSLAVITMLEVELADLDALQVQLVLALVL